MDFNNWMAVLNFIVLFITLAVLIRYAYDTYGMQKSTKRQIELQLKPLIAIEAKSNHERFSFVFTNIGNGTAINIQVEPIEFGSTFTDLKFEIPFLPSLRSGELKALDVQALISGQKADKSWTAHINHKYANRTLDMTINYEDIEFKKIKQKFTLGVKDLKISMTE